MPRISNDADRRVRGQEEAKVREALGEVREDPRIGESSVEKTLEFSEKLNCK